MNKAKLIEALNSMDVAIKDLIASLNDATAVTADAEPVADTKVDADTKEEKVVTKKTTKTSVSKKEEVSKEPVETKEQTTEETEVPNYESFSYNDLKKYAQSLGIKAVGTRDQIIAKIEEVHSSGAETKESDSEPVEEKDEKVVPFKGGKKSGIKKKEEPVEEPMDETEKKVREEADAMDVTEIAELLESIGVKAKGNKKTLVNALVKAVKDGKLDFSEDDDEEVAESDETESVEDDATDVDFYAYHSEFDPSSLNDPENMTKERAKAVKSMIDRELEAIDSNETSEKDVKAFIDTILTEEEKDSYSNSYDMDDEETIIHMYLELMKSFIDDEGEEHEPGDPYTIGEENVCCGHVLVYDEDSEQYICESCGQTYEAE